MNRTNNLRRNLSVRHVRFISMSSAIGTGFFYGSTDAIRMAGPSVLISYTIGGIVAYVTMSALGEMLVHNPSVGSFFHYAQENLGSLAGYITGWTYFFETLIVPIADVTTFGIYMGAWFPAVPRWIWVFSVMLLICVINLMSVKLFGELEFWFASFKIFIIVSMIVIGLGVIIAGTDNEGQPVGISNLWENGGFFSRGLFGTIMSLQIVIFAYGGIEIIGILAEEVRDPIRSIVPCIVNSVPIRILTFYVGTLFVIMSIYPWNQIGINGSPFVLAFQHIGITFSASVLNLVMLATSFSSINSDVFSIGRILYGMAEQGNAPKVFTKISHRGIPWVTILVMAISLLFSVFLNYIMPERVFIVLASIATFSTAWVWMMILLSQIAFRYRLSPEETKELKFKVPGGVLTTGICLIFILFTIILMGYYPNTRVSLYLGSCWIVLLLICWTFKSFKCRHNRNVT